MFFLKRTNPGLLALLLAAAAIALPVPAGAYYTERLTSGIPGMDILPAADAGRTTNAGNIPERPLAPVQVEAQPVPRIPSPKPSPKAIIAPDRVPQVHANAASPKAPAGTAKPAAVPGRRLGIGVNHVGTKGTVAPVTARGKDMPLSAAMPLILPKGWDQTIPAALGTKTVSFAAEDEPWTEVLAGMAKEAKVAAIVDWGKGAVRLAAPGTVVAKETPAASPKVSQPKASPGVPGIARDFAATPAMGAAGSGQTRQVQGGGGVTFKPAKIGMLPRTMTAAEAARHFKANPERFYMWNECGYSAVFQGGTEVFLEDPYVVATATPETPQAAPPPPSVPPAPVPAQAAAPAKHKLSQPAPRPVAATPPPPAPAPAPAAQASGKGQGPFGERPLEMSPEADIPPATPVSTTWTLAPGALAKQLQSWVQSVGYQLVWRLADDFHLTTNASFSGNMESALTWLATNLARGGHPMRVAIHEGNRVVEISEE